MSDFVVIGFKTTFSGDKATDWVEIAPAGEAFERTRTWHRVKDILPPENVDEVVRNSPGHRVLVARWEAIKPKFDAWKAGEEIPTDGVPLAAWAGVSPEQVGYLRAMGIYTVEAVRDMGEGAMTRLPFPNARQLPKLAGEFLLSRGDAEKDREMANMRERMAFLEGMLVEKQEEKRGPGRPRKQEEAA